MPVEPEIRFEPSSRGDSAIMCGCGWYYESASIDILAKQTAAHMEKTGHKVNLRGRES